MPGTYAKYTANTGIGSVSTTNTALDGSGTLTTLLVAADNGTLIRSVTIKSQVNVGSGNIIRLFFSPDGDSIYLFKEVLFRPSGGGSAALFASCKQNIALNLPLTSGAALMASTDAGKKFSIAVEGVNWTYP